ncbi:MAG TPA: LysR substrate-binding domain-containing protein, partial [Steroidobacteraceae bacterium]|nr:LysR substrate-binding domain-containing protein [Steroidobacteraceae bacterium]
MHQRFPSLKALRAFEAVVRLRSAVKAGDELHVSAGAVSHQIRALEQELGFRLFDRASGELAPTAVALELAEQVRGGFDLIFAAVRRSRLSGDPTYLTVSCDVTFGILWLGPRIARFRARHPDIDVRLDLTDSDPDTFWRNVDVMIYFGYGRFSGYEAIRLTSESLSAVCSPQYLRDASSVREPADILSCPLIHVEWFEPDTSFRTLAWEKWFAAAGVPLNGVRLSGMHFSHTANALQVAMSGAGFALASDCLAVDALSSGALVRPFDVRLKLPRDYYLVHAEAVADLGKVAAFREWL